MKVNPSLIAFWGLFSDKFAETSCFPVVVQSSLVGSGVQSLLLIRYFIIRCSLTQATSVTGSGA